MYLKRIDIHGFKSFADNISIDIAEGITAIVGPNGSGKSNISDAVRWVLGEQSAKALRGAKMEDVIFDGAEKRRPLSFCEVSLTFNNEDSFLALPHNEVSISRRVYRSGESEYLINNSACRMKDINALFYDTGVGRVGYSIIGQGRIEEILSPKGDERRAAFEEAAGVMKYKVRREESQRKLRNVGKDMQRIDDIVGELELSLEPLRLQCEQAREYMAIKQNLKDLEVNLFLNRYKTNEEKRYKLDQQERELNTQEKADTDKDASIRHQQSILNEKADLTQQLLDRAREKELEYSSGMQRVTGELELLKQKQQYLQAELTRFTTERAAAQQGVDEITQTLQNSEITGDDIILLRENELARLEQDAAQAQKQAEQTENELDRLKQKLMDIMDDSGEKKARQARLEALAEQARQKLEEIKESISQMQQEHEQLSGEALAAKNEADELYKQRDDTAYAVIAAEEESAGLQQQAEACDKAARAAEQETQNSAQTLKIQLQLKQDLEGYANSVRSLMRGIDGQAGGVYGVVGNLLKVPKKYEKAIELTLGGGLQNVVVQDEQVAKRLIAYLRKNDFGRVTFLPVDALRPRTFSNNEKSQLSGKGVLGIASELVEYGREVKLAAEYLLGRTVIVEDMDSGIAISRKLSFSFRCVTLQGDIINAGGPITGGSNRERGLVSRDRLIADARAKMEKAAEVFKQQSSHAERLKAKLEAKNTEAQALRKDVYSIEARIAAIEERLDATVYQKQRAEEALARHNEDIARAEAAIQATQDSSRQAEQTGDEDEELLRKAIETVGSQLAEQRSRRDEAIELYNKERVEFASFYSEVAADKKNRERLERELGQLIQEIQAKTRSAADNENELLRMEQKIEQTQQQYNSMLAENEENDVALNKLDDEIARQEKQMNDFAAERESIQQRINESVKKRYGIKAQMERLLAEFEGMQNRIWEEYNLSYATAKEFEREIKVGEATAQIDELRTRLREMDNVNPGAIEEYERVSTRYEFLTAQREDLSKAKVDLGLLIDELTKEMESKFLDQFYKINECFGRVFKSLFGGGKAELVLQDKDNAMESQIEIIAQPPGKKLQLLSLLSGGERALTAIAILFAMLELKATPFCILDEIEAALDEENLRLFADYLKDYSKRTQFIVITHRRPTMEAASTMYGIAMEEKGVSKLVSVKFADAV